MRLHRFYVREALPPAGGNMIVEIDSPELVHQIRNVFRMKVGDKIIIFNGTGFDYECKIDGFEKRNKISSNSVICLTVQVSTRNNNISGRKLFLCASLIKKDHFEWVVEKATELGVTDIVPISAERSEKKSLNEERLRKIVIEASEQSGRDTTPMVRQIMGLGSAVSLLKKENSEIKILTFHTEGESVAKYRSLVSGVTNGEGCDIKNTKANTPIAVFIGPEGGWSVAEIETFHREGVEIVCLGPQVLRAETAVVVALSIVVFG